MNFNFKSLGLALLAMFVMTAMFASGAQAEVKGTLGASSAWLTGEVIEHPGIGKTQTFTLAGGQVFSCEQIGFVATVKNGDTTVTVVPSYSKCSARIGSETHLMTVTMNDCDYLFYGGKEVSSTTFNEGQGDLVCPTGKKVEVHVYKGSTNETEELCTLTIPPFVNNVGGESHNISGSPNTVTTTSTTKNIVVNRIGSLLCGAASTTATYTGSTTLKAFEDLGGTISNGTVSGLVEGKQVSLTASS